MKKLPSPPILYLASRSPRRQELLNQASLRFRVYVPKEEEQAAPKKHGKLLPSLIVRKIATGKAVAALRELREAGKDSGIILAADTLVFFRGRVLGKPTSKKEAEKMLTALSGNWHMVSTAVTCVSFTRSKVKQKTIHLNTKVKFFPLPREWIRWYIGTGEPMDKAGSYGAQNQGATMIEKISGSYTNVVGLPIGHTLKLLAEISGHDVRAFMGKKS